MKTKIELKKNDLYVINHIFDIVKSNKGEVLEYSDSHILIEGSEMLLKKSQQIKLF